MKRRRVLLISPSSDLENKPKKTKFQTHPLGLLYIAAVLEKEGFDVQICDAHSFGYSLGYIRRNIESFKPDIVGLTAMTIFSPSAYRVAKEVKKVNPSILTIMGGPHATALPQEALNEGAIDVVVQGEGEYAMLELCGITNESSYSLSSIKGIFYKANGQVCKTEQRPALKDLDIIPYPAYHLLARMKEYNPPPHWGKKGRFASLITSRGCPYGCIFCSVTRAWGSQYRYRSPENVLAELELLIKRYQVIYFTLRDSTFTLYKSRAIEICKGIINNGFNIKWNCNSRPNEIDEDLLYWMKKSGCDSIQFGIECGNKEMLRKFKSLDRETVTWAIKLTDKFGIKPHGYFMFGLPGETHDTMRETINFAKSLPLYSAGFTTVTPFPGSQLWDYSVKNNLVLTRQWSRYNLKESSVLKYPNLSPIDLMRTQRKAFREFYLRPRVFFYHLAKIKNMQDFSNYIYEALINWK